MDFLKRILGRNNIESLLDAVRENDVAKVERLVLSGIGVNEQNKYSATPLFVACSLGHVQVATKLISLGADVNFAGNPNRMTALMNAAHHGKQDKTDCIRLLLGNGADASICDEEGFTALMHGVLSTKYVPDYMTRDQSIELCKLLIEVTPNIDQRSSKDSGYQRTALMYAAMHGYIDQYILLAEAGADFSLKDGLGNDVKELAWTNACFHLHEMMDSIHENAVLKRSIGVTEPNIESTISF